MIDRVTFAEGMALLDAAFPTNLDERERHLRLKVYYSAIASDMTPEEWQHAIDDTIKTFHQPPMFPPVERLLRHVNSRKLLTLTEEAVVEYERVADAYTSIPGRGVYWRRDEVEKKCGARAARAFQIAGGDAAFQTVGNPRNEPFVRKAFVEAYVEDKRATPLLLKGGATGEITDGAPRSMVPRKPAAE